MWGGLNNHDYKKLPRSYYAYLVSIKDINTFGFASTTRCPVQFCCGCSQSRELVKDCSFLNHSQQCGNGNAMTDQKEVKRNEGDERIKYIPRLTCQQ